jgi:UDP-glucose 4-epimerase
MRVLVTGGAGFIGSHLSERLLSLGHQVVVIDDLSTGSIENIVGCRDSHSFLFHHDSIFNHDRMTELIRGCDVIFHLAAAVGVKKIVDFPVSTIETNVAGTEVVLRLAAAQGRRVILASTSEVYGKSTKFPFSESDDIVLGPTTNTRWGYACSKAIDEFLALAYALETQLPVTVVRLFNTVGPRQTGIYGMVVPSLVKQALSGGPVTVYGTGDQSRCFGHVFDIVDGFVSILNNAATDGEIFNLGNTQEVTINELAAHIVAATGSDSKIVHVPYSQAYGPGFEDMHRRVPDITKAREWLGFSPKRTLDDIIADVVNHLRPQLAGVALDGTLERVL